MRTFRDCGGPVGPQNSCEQNTEPTVNKDVQGQHPSCDICNEAAVFVMMAETISPTNTIFLWFT